MKICKTCGCNKDLDKFFKDKSKYDGLSSKCKDCIKSYNKDPDVIKRRNENQRSRYENSKEIFSQHSKRYYELNKERILLQHKDYADANKDKLSVASSIYRSRPENKLKDSLHHKKSYVENKEKIDARNKLWASANKEKRRSYVRHYQKRNNHIILAISASRRSSKINATPVWRNKFFISEIYHIASLRNKTKGIKWHVDHIVPLKSKIVCGLHVESNLQVIPASINLSKSNRYWPDMPD